jgi:hypothetical protein
MTSAARRTSQTPMKVYERTRSQARYAAALKETTQAEIVEMAMNEYIERHVEEFALGLKQAREALFIGANSALAYVMNEDADEIRDVVGDLDPDLFKPRRAELPRTKRDS